jgi:serine/threonine protein kinase
VFPPISSSSLLTRTPKSNILVTESKRACLADFGFSSVMDSQGLKTASLSSATPEGGTVRFQAPELINPQFEGSRSPASDVYAFALVCYEVRTPYT